MTARTFVVLALVALLGAACASGSSDPEVLGVLVERSPSPSATDEVSSTPAEAREAVAVRTRADVTAEDDPAPARQSPVAPASPAPPPQPEPQPEPSPSPSPAHLAEGDGNTYTWTPRDEPDEGYWWVEASSLPPSSPDADEWNGQRVTAVDVAPPADGSDPAMQPSRRVACDAWIVAPDDRSVVGDGNVTIELLVNGAVAASTVVPFEGEVAAGTRRTFDRLGDVAVDARDGDDAACKVRFDAS